MVKSSQDKFSSPVNRIHKAGNELFFSAGHIYFIMLVECDTLCMSN